MSDLRVGFIGAGRIADLHARAYTGDSRGALTAVADATPGRARERADQWGAERAYENYQDLLADDGIDAVEILLPHDLHQQVAMEALRAGKAVSLQKPLGLTLEEADTLLACARSAGPTFRVFDNFLYWEPFQLAKKLIDNGEIGDPLLIRISAIYGQGIGAWDIPAEAKAWRSKPERVGGPPAIVDHGAHMAATIEYLMGPVASVHTFNETGNESSGVAGDSPLVVSCKFAHKSRLGVWTMTRTSGIEIKSDYYPGDEFLEVTGSKGIVWVNRCSGQLLDAPPVTLYVGGRARHFHDMELDWGESFRAGGEQFIDGVLDGTQPDMDAKFARSVFVFQLAAVRSAEQGREVPVAEFG